MPTDIIFIDPGRQEEIDTFYKACQMQRDYYRGYPGANHPLDYFRDTNYMWQCPPQMTPTYLKSTSQHVKYKDPAVLPVTMARTIHFPPLPGRTLAGRFNKEADRRYVR